MKANFFSAAANFLKKDVNTSLSVGYISLVVIGMVFEGCLYNRFHINIVQYSDISDFLLAPFRNPKILFFSGLSILFIYTIMLFDKWLEKKYPNLYKWIYWGKNPEKYKEWFSIQGIGITIGFYVFFAADVCGSREAKTIKRKLIPDTELTFKDSKFVETDALIYIGKTNGYVFLYNRTKKQTDVVPMGDVLKIEVRK